LEVCNAECLFERGDVREQLQRGAAIAIEIGVADGITLSTRRPLRRGRFEGRTAAGLSVRTLYPEARSAERARYCQQLRSV
jgi:hypothetical protein